jgi:3-deoxy-D-manno-octulosonic-acid transferase
MSRWLYTLLLYLLVPVVLLRLQWRGRANPDYRRRWAERFGWFTAPALKQPIWVHAVSVGEALAAVPLIEALLARYPERSLVITSTTPTGSGRVQALFGGRVFHVYLPYDLPGAVRRFLDRTRPCVGIIMETELWPNLFHHCARRRIPLAIVNARLSPGSARGYARIAPLARATLADVRLIAAQGEGDADRFRALGARDDQVQVMGNLKFDQTLPADLAAQAAALRNQWGIERPVWIAASTHEGEDAQVLDAFALIRQVLPTSLLILVPRHQERFDRVAALVQARDFQMERRASGEPASADTQIFLGDTLGELPLFYAAADVAFVGGSLVPVGWHNMLEPAALGVPVLTGPARFNFSDISEALLAAGAAREVTDAETLAAAVIHWLGDAEDRQRAGEAGRQLVAANRGSLERLLGLLSPLLDARV